MTDWDKVEGPEAAERILRAAVLCGASEINFSTDAEGATVFFLSCEQIELFDHLPPRCRDAVRDWLKQATGIEPWSPPPATGYASFFGIDGTTCEYEVRTIGGARGEDLVIKITRG